MKKAFSQYQVKILEKRYPIDKKVRLSKKSHTTTKMLSPSNLELMLSTDLIRNFSSNILPFIR